jgi:hypothetical protein
MGLEQYLSQHFEAGGVIIQAVYPIHGGVQGVVRPSGWEPDVYSKVHIVRTPSEFGWRVNRYERDSLKSRWNLLGVTRHWTRRGADKRALGFLRDYRG